MKTYKIMLASLLLLIAVSTGCAGKAMDAISRAHAAIKMARGAGAEKLAPVEFSRAVTAFELAEKAIIAEKYGQAEGYAVEAEQRATAAAQKAKKVRAAPPRGIPIPIISVTEPAQPPPAIESNPKRIENETNTREEAAIEPDNSINTRLIRKRYITVAQRRIKNAALANFRGNVERGKIELEVWVTADGRVIRIILVEGDDTTPLAKQVLNGMDSLKLDPFPAGMKKTYLKIRVKIDTTQNRGSDQ